MLDEAVDNHGERLVPGESHDSAETIRHKSSYAFFRAIIEADLERDGPGRIRILDLGCGVGHGTAMLADIDGAEIVGFDASGSAIAYATEHYAAPNVTYVAAMAEEYQRVAEPFDYVVSRHALEHIPDGLELALSFPCTRRLIVNVPYREPAHDAGGETTNPHHEVNDISEAHFSGYPRAEFFFEDLEGVTTVTPDGAVSIICVSSAPDLPPAASSLTVPIPPWRPSRLEAIALAYRDAQIDLDGRNREVEAWKQACADLEEAHAARMDELRDAYEELKTAHAAEMAELRSAYDDLARDHQTLRDSKAVRAALGARRVYSRVRRPGRG
jgi:SAM-dependent methyltransferase